MSQDHEITVVTSTVKGATTAVLYKRAVYEVRDGFLVITHVEGPGAPVLVSRVPLANVVQICEVKPGEPS